MEKGGEVAPVAVEWGGTKHDAVQLYVKSKLLCWHVVSWLNTDMNFFVHAHWFFSIDFMSIEKQRQHHWLHVNFKHALLV